MKRRKIFPKPVGGVLLFIFLNLLFFFAGQWEWLSSGDDEVLQLIGIAIVVLLCIVLICGWAYFNQDEDGNLQIKRSRKS